MQRKKKRESEPQSISHILSLSHCSVPLMQTPPIASAISCIIDLRPNAADPKTKRHRVTTQELYDGPTSQTTNQTLTNR